MVQGKWFPPGKDPSPEVSSIRRAVFCRGSDSLDPESWNAVIYEDGTAVATGRIWWRDGVFWIGDLAVLPDCRGRRYGDLLLRLLLFKAQSHFAREVRLECPPDVAGFFSRLGFRSVRESGQVEMLLPGDRIELDQCRSCPRNNCPNRQ